MVAFRARQVAALWFFDRNLRRKRDQVQTIATWIRHTLGRGVSPAALVWAAQAVVVHGLPIGALEGAVERAAKALRANGGGCAECALVLTVSRAMRIHRVRDAGVPRHFHVPVPLGIGLPN